MKNKNNKNMKMKLKSLMENKEAEARCPECESFGSSIQKKGLRRNKREEIQKYYCKNCKRYFVMKKMLNKSYPTNVILNAISFYNKGMSLENASKKVNMKFCIKTYPRLISSWMNEFSDICTFRRIRGEFVCKRGFAFSNPVFEKLIEHKQPYLYKYHKLKMDMFLTEYFSGLMNYLFSVAETCPHELFLKDNLRSSQIKINYANSKLISVEKKNNYACKLAGLALKMARTNRERHEIVQDFMLSNDTSTIAVEVPIWLTSEEVDKLNFEFGIFSDVSDIFHVSDVNKNKKDDGEFSDAGSKQNNKDWVNNKEGVKESKINNNNIVFNNEKVSNIIVNNDNNKKVNNIIFKSDMRINKINYKNINEKRESCINENNSNNITGHIDIVQARFGLIYVLDYKPEAEKVDAVSQLFTYALALSVRTDIWLRNFRCAWFDEKVYYEFNPNDIILACIFKKLGADKIPEEYLKKYVLNEKDRSYFTSLWFHEIYLEKKQEREKRKEDEKMKKHDKEIFGYDEEIGKKVTIFSRMKNDDFFRSNMEIFEDERMKKVKNR